MAVMFMLDNDDDNCYDNGIGVVGGWCLLPMAGDFFAFLLVAWCLWWRGSFSIPDAAVTVVVVVLVVVVIVDATVVIWCVYGVVLSFAHVGIFVGYVIAP